MLSKMRHCLELKPVGWQLVCCVDVWKLTRQWHLNIEFVMQANRTTRAPDRRRFRGITVAMVALFLLLVTLASSPALHHAIHSDANSPGHHCVITALSHGQIDTPICATPLSPVSFHWDYAVPFLVSLPGTAVELLPPGRGPPSFFS